MKLFQAPWLHQLPEPTGHFSGGPPRRFGSRRRNRAGPDDGGAGGADGAGSSDGAGPYRPAATTGG
jgi:hypothetical protein